MNKLKDKSEINKITILFVFVYMVSYMTRINYGAIVSEMVRATGIPKSLLSMGLTGSFITYGIGQSMHGVNSILVCMVPQFFEKDGCVSTVSGILNSCTYIGSAASTYGIALFSEKIGWQGTIFLWVLIALAGTLICMMFAKMWKKKGVVGNEISRLHLF